MLMFLSAAAALTFSPATARADIVYICDDGRNIVVKNATRAKIAKLRRTNKCVRDFHRRAAERRKRREKGKEKWVSAAWYMCGRYSCPAISPRHHHGHHHRRRSYTAYDIHIYRHRRH